MPHRCRSRAQLLTSDVDERDRPFIGDDRTPEGFFRIRPGCGKDYAIARSLAYAPYADLLWWETCEPDLSDARQFAEAIHRRIPGQDAGLQLLARASTGSRRWRRRRIAEFQRELGAMGYKFQFVTLAGFHSLNLSMFKLARGYKERGMARLLRAAAGRVRGRVRGLHRDAPPARGRRRLLRRRRDRGRAAASPRTTALATSTEAAQFHDEHAPAH